MIKLRELIKPTRYPIDPQYDNDDGKDYEKDETFEKKPDAAPKSNADIKTEGKLTDDKIQKNTEADDTEDDDVEGTNESKVIKKIKSFVSGKAPNNSVDDTSNSPMVDEAINYSPETLLHKEISPHYKFNKDEKQYLNNYSLGSSINSYLWDKHKGTVVKDRNSKNNDLYTKKMDEVIKNHKTPRDFTVYSGTKHDPTKLKNSEGIVHHPAYISTSLKKDTAIDFASNHQTHDEEGNIHNHILKIHVPKGHSGAYIANISKMKGEKEFLLPRGLNMKITGYHNEKYPRGNSGKNNIYHIHHMEIV